jgi:hypothetical protein
VIQAIEVLVLFLSGLLHRIRAVEPEDRGLLVGLQKEVSRGSALSINILPALGRGCLG